MIIRNISTVLASLGFVAIGLVGTTHADSIFYGNKTQSPVARACGSPIPSIEEGVESARIVNDWKEKGGMKRLSTTTIQVPTYYHVIEKGLIGNTQSEADESIQVLNNAFTSHFSFNLINTTFTDNSSWFDYRSKETEMKSALREGGCDALNIYATSGYGILGVANFPNSCGSSSDPYVGDGVVIHYASVPDGSFANFNKGYTLIHEVGHWLGLYHTFQDGCFGEGDYVDDTPAHTVNYDCATQDTCTSAPGLDPVPDPINNFMNYTPDSCMDEFTQDQYARMVAQWDEYRKPASSPTSSPTQGPVKQPTSSPTSSPARSPTPNPTSSPVKQPTSSLCGDYNKKRKCKRAVDECFWFEKTCAPSRPCTNFTRRRQCKRAKCNWNKKSKPFKCTI